MKKILHVLVEPKFAGAQRISFEILRSLNTKDFIKYVLVGSGEDFESFKEEFSRIGVKVIEMPNLKREICASDLWAFYDIYKLCRQIKFDIVHTNSTKPGIIARIAARLAGVKLVIHTVHGITFHRFEAFYKRVFFYLIEIFASLFGHKLVIVNKFYKKYYPLLSPITIYNGSDFERFQVKSKAKDVDGLVNILFLARLDFQKSPLTLLAAAYLLINKFNCKNIKITLVGGGELFEECSRFIFDKGLNDYVFLEGWKSNVSDFYANSHIFCMPSLYESFGLVFLEAGYHSIPTVATNVEGIPEVVIHEKTGLLVPPNDPYELANALFYLIENKEIREGLGQNAKEWAVGFDIVKTAKQYQEIYSLEK